MGAILQMWRWVRETHINHTVGITSPVTSRERATSSARELFRARQFHLLNYCIKLYASHLTELVDTQLCPTYTLGPAGSGAMKILVEPQFNKLDRTSKLLCCFQTSLNGSLHFPIMFQGSIHYLFLFVYVRLMFNKYFMENDNQLEGNQGLLPPTAVTPERLNTSRSSVVTEFNGT